MSPTQAEPRRIVALGRAEDEETVRAALRVVSSAQAQFLIAGTDYRKLISDLEHVAPDLILADGARPEHAILASWTGALVVGIGEPPPPAAPDLFRSRDDPGAALRFACGRSCAAWAADWNEGVRIASALLDSSSEGATRAGALPRGPTTSDTLPGVLEIWRAILWRRPALEAAWVREFARRLVRRESPAPPADHTATRPRGTRSRIAIVVHEFSRSGSPIQMLRSVRALLACHPLPWDIHVVGLQRGPIEEDFSGLGIETSCVPEDRIGSEPDWLLEHLESIDPDAVLLNGSTLFREAVLLKTRGHRVLWWIHSGIHYATREGGLIADDALAHMVRHALGFPDRLIFAAQDTLEQFVMLNPGIAGRSVHIPNGLQLDEVDAALASLEPDRVELRRSLGIDPGDIVLVGIGSLERRKNQSGLVRGFQTTLRRLPREYAARARLLLVGPLTCPADPGSQYLAGLRAEIDPSWAEHIRIVGPVPSPWPWLAAADAHVLLSINECSPLANIEALFASVPCLSSRVHGIPEAVTDGISGWLVDPRDENDVEAGIERVIRLACDDPDVLRRMGRAGREDMKRRFRIESSATALRSEIALVLRDAPDSRHGVPAGPVARSYFELLLTLRWALVKGDMSTARHIAQAHAHRLYQWPAPSASRPAVAYVAARGNADANSLLRELREIEIPWSIIEIPAPESANDPGRWTPILAAIAAARANVVVALGADMTELVILAHWKGWHPVWVRRDAVTVDPSGPEFFLSAARRLETHGRRTAARVTSPDANAVIAAIDCAMTGERPLNAAPDGSSTWRELQEQLELLRAVLARDGSTEIRISTANAARWAQGSAPRPRPPRPKPPRARVLFVTHQYSRTGAPIEMFHLVRALRDPDAGFDFVATGFEDGPMRAALERDAGIQALLVRRDDPPWVFDSLLAQIDEIDPDIVILNASVFYQESALVRLKGRRVAWWIHDGIDAKARRGHLFTDDALATMTLHGLVYPDRLFFPARDTLEQFAACCPDIRARSVHLRNGIDLASIDEARRRWLPERPRLRRETGIGAGDFVFLCIGSFERRKNQCELVEAFQDLLESEPEAKDAHLLFLGNPRPYDSGPDVGFFEEVRSAVRPRHRGHVHFLGLEPSAYPRLAIADAHVLVSTNESSPLANLEAMAFGIPCVSSRIDGIPEVLGSGERGLLVDPGDRAGIRGVLRDLLRRTRAGDPTLATLRERARAYVEREHDIAVTARCLANEIRAILAERPVDDQPALRTAEADRYVQGQVIQRWATFKKDLEVEAHIVRSHAHRFYRAPGA